ncbi:unnamed protein product [Dicrocoelium dendriticum]|nr:unnamed protein product [Dicrocoelium dendriticum]
MDAYSISSSIWTGTASNRADPLDDYNPFAEPTTGFRYGAPPMESVPDTAVNEKEGGNLGGSVPPPAQLPPFSATSMLNNDAILALERRQAELEARAAELDRKEKEQHARLAAYQAGAPPHNWPPLPSWCPCKPCVRQDFETDIPADCRWLAKMGYGIWLAYVLVLLINMGGTLSYFIVGHSSVEGPLFGASILLFLVMPPASFFGWHRPLYKALRSDSSVNYVIFFILFAAQVIIILIQCLGIDYLGSCTC